MKRNYKLDEINKIQQQMQEDIFKILLKSNVISHLSSSVKTRTPLYQFTRFYDYLTENLPEQAINFMDAIKGLFKVKFLYIIVVDKRSHHIQFITQSDYNQLTWEERVDFSLVPSEVVFNTINLN